LLQKTKTSYRLLVKGKDKTKTNRILELKQQHDIAVTGASLQEHIINFLKCA